VAVIEDARAVERVTVEAFDWRVQRHIRSRRPDIRLAWLTSAETVRDAALWWDGAMTEAAVQEAHKLGLSVLPWTVNRSADMRRLIDWGVDGLISDRPDLALAL
jgi:glycerophosphoryl diester phosphodiesterase